MTDINVTKPVIASVPDVLYTFLVTNITCLTSEQQPSLDGEIFNDVPYQHVMTPPPPTMQMNVQQRLQSRKMRGRKTQKLNAMKCDQFLLKKNPLCYLECTVLYKRYRSLALNIGLLKKKKVGENVLWNKRYIHSLQSSVFATRKKGVAEARNWFIVCFPLKLSQKQNEHASSTFFLSKFYISSKTYVLEDQTLYIFFEKRQKKMVI